MKERIQQLEKEIAELKAQLEDSEQEFEEGQWVHAEGHAAGEYLFRYKQEKQEAYFKNASTYKKRSHAEKGWRDSTVRPATEDEIKEALVAEAKRRGWDTKEGEYFDYMPQYDTLMLRMSNGIGKRRIYEGRWAEPVKDTVTINGVECEVKSDRIQFGCGDSVEMEHFRIFKALVGVYDLTVTRKGEDITPQIKKLGEMI